MSKRVKSVSMMIALMGAASMGAMYAEVLPSVDGVRSVQQAGTCTGVVKDATGETVIGASVVVKGTTNGTITGLDGDFSLSGVKKGDIIQISFVGYETQEIVFNGQPLNVTLKDDSQQLEEVVVTALGMKREKKALGYAVTEMKGDELNSNVINPVSALQGKVAGVEINSGDGGMFGSSKIMIRGASTLGSNNQPIYVVDGIILDNSVKVGSADWDSDTSYGDYGNELKNLNPSDFETVSVLKGAAATALYGSRGLNGAVVITTKSGKGKKGLGINVTQTFGFDKMTSTPDLQNEYGPGYLTGYTSWAEDSKYNVEAWYHNADGVKSVKDLMQDGYYAWGPHFDGSSVEYVDGTMQPYVPFKNNFKDAYQTGFNSTTNVAINGGNEKTTFYVSMGYKYAESTTVNNTFNRINLMAKASHKITDKVEVEASMTFANSIPKNAPFNMSVNFIDGTFARNYNVKALKHLYKGSHGGLASTAYGDQYGNLPGNGVWWTLYENEYKQKETTVRPSLKLTAHLTDWLTFAAEGNYNYYYTRYENKQPGSGYANEGGYYGMGNSTKEQTNLNATFNANHSFGDFELHGFLRGEYYNSITQSLSLGTNGGLVARNKFFIANSINTPSYSGKIEGEKRMLSVAAQVGTSWKDQLYLDVTGRNDWSSALVYADGHGTYSYFYPSISGSWLISSTFREKLPEWISFMKLRGSWAQVGNDTDPYILNTAYLLNTGTINGNRVSGTELSSTTYSNNLKPERKNSWEVGLDWRFLNNRIGLDFTYYKENTKDQIMRISVPSVSGISGQYINAGNIQNSGVEIALNTTPIETKDWTWDLNLTYTRNRSKIVELHENVADYIALSGDAAYGNYRVGSVAKVGGAYGLLLSDSTPLEDEVSGKKVLDWSNNMIGSFWRRSGELKEVGDINPDFLASINTNLRYKNWNLSVSMDARFGGKVASYGGRYGTAYGFTKSSLQYRDAAHGGATYTSRWDGITYDDGVIPDGIFLAGTKISQPDGSFYTVGTGQYSTGETFVELMNKGMIEPTHANVWTNRNNRWINVASAPTQGVITAETLHTLNYIALRDVSLSYTMPSSIANKVGAKSLMLTAAAHNLGYILNTLPNHENPEAVRGTVAHEFRLRNFDGVTTNFTFTINASF